MTITEIKLAIANYFEVAVSALTVNGQDLGLLALNQVKHEAELKHDFEFQRRLVTITVNGVTGGSLDAAVLASDGVTPVAVKTVIEAGLFDTNNNLCPIEWTTVAEGMERQRQDNRFGTPRYTTDDWYAGQPAGGGRFTFSGSQIFRWPKDTTTNFTLGLEVYSFSSPFAAATATVSGATGTLAACNGVYSCVGTYNDKQLYLMTGTTGFAIWWDGASKWIISAAGIIAKLGVFTYYDITSSTFAPPTTGWTGHGGTTGTIAIAFTDTAVTNEWTNYATQFLQWGAICQLNYLFEKFVYRQEGSLTAPEKLRDAGLDAFIEWDAEKFEAYRRHNR